MHRHRYVLQIVRQTCSTHTYQGSIKVALHLYFEEHLYVQKRHMHKAPRKSRQAPNGKAVATTARVMLASKKNSIFSTMSAHSLGSEDELVTSYGAVDRVSALLVRVQLSSLLCHSPASYIRKEEIPLWSHSAIF
jgi:hypothetical protein